MLEYKRKILGFFFVFFSLSFLFFCAKEHDPFGGAELYFDFSTSVHKFTYIYI